MKVVRQLIDPQAALSWASRQHPRSDGDGRERLAAGVRQLNIAAYWLSDSLCRLSSGGGSRTRTLLIPTTRRVVFQSERPIILNGIDEFVAQRRPVDRVSFVHLSLIGRGKTMAKCMSYWARSGGSAEDTGRAVGRGRRGASRASSVRLEELPRMADFPRWGVAVGRGLGAGAWDIPGGISG